MSCYYSKNNSSRHNHFIVGISSSDRYFLTIVLKRKLKVMQKCGLIKEAEHIDYEWHDGKMKTRLEYRMLRREWKQSI